MLAKQEHNGGKGEARTCSILINEFWILERNVDVEGADFLVQVPALSQEELVKRRNRIQSLGIIQAKYFEGKNQVRISREYVLEAGSPFSEFFAILHTDDEEGGHHHYFFDAKDIVNNLYESSCGKYFCFSFTKNRDYKEFRDIPEKTILSRIRTAVLLAECDRNQRLVKQLYHIFATPTQHYDIHPEFTYKLAYVDDHPIVLCRNQKNGNKHLLEYRRDIFKNLGNFTWGYKGTGSYFLSACLLAHHFDGAAPSEDLVLRLRDNLLLHLDRELEHTITSNDIRAAIGRHD